MQKQLITDQLIEEYYRELDRLFSQPANEYAAIKIRTISKFITRLRSLRQQEVQNIKDARNDGFSRTRIGWESDEKGDKQYLFLEISTDNYFTQTFEQKGGGNGI